MIVLAKKQTLPSLAEYLTVAEAAELLGVSSSTLRNWDRSGKLSPRRHPLNGYRLYRRDELESLMKRVEKAGQKAAR